MKFVAEMEFSEFVELIPEEFNRPRQKKYKLYQEKVGKVLQRYRDTRMPSSNDKFLRHEKWRKWFSQIDYKEAQETVEKIDDAIAADLMRGKGDAAYYNAIYYRFHSLLDDLAWADEIDAFVFGTPLRHRGASVLSTAA